MALQLSGDTVVWIGLSLGSVVLVLVYLLNQLRLKKRDAHLKLETTQSLPERAENQIQLARSGADHLARQGFDVSAVEESIRSAEAALARRNFAVAIRIAEESREKLIALREGRTAPAPAPSVRTPASVLPVAAMVVAGAGSGRTASTTPSAPEGDGSENNRTKLPAHQVEARFEISLLKEELGRPAAPNADPAARKEAADLAGKAQAAYEAKSYAEAWQLALRGRRRAGAAIERIGGKAPTPAPRADDFTELGPSGSDAPASGAGDRAGGVPCPTCGQTIRPSDRFCRACGGTLGAGRCPRCGAPQEPSDRFCGVCGSPVGG